MPQCCLRRFAANVLLVGVGREERVLEERPERVNRVRIYVFAFSYLFHLIFATRFLPLD